MAARVRRIPARSKVAQETVQLEKWRALKDAEIRRNLQVPEPGVQDMGHGAHYVLYRFYDANGVLLYVGITMNLPSRLRNHEDTKPWWHQVASMTAEHFLSRSDVFAAEKFAIKAERPIYNGSHNCGRRQ